MPLVEAPLPENSIREQKGKFLIRSCDCSALCRPIQQSLLALSQRCGSIEGHLAVIPDNHRNALILQQFWQSLPGNINKGCTPDLHSLLEREPGKLTLAWQGREQRNFVEVSCNLRIAGQLITAAALRTALKRDECLLRGTTGWLSIDPEKAQAILEQLESEGYSDSPKMLLRREASHRLQQLADQDGISLDEETRSYLDSLRRDPVPEIPPLPSELTDILRPYQAAGYAFLADRCLNGAGSILADDMGLGKTLQVLALLSAWKQRGEGNFSALVVCPASVMSIWEQQAAKFCPALSVLLWSGSRSERQQSFAAGGYDLLITHYGMARIETSRLCSREFTFVILDEAQAIKNPDAQVSRALRRLRCRHRVAITGTPMENKLLDLWSIMDFLNPKLLGTKESFLTLGQNSLPEIRSQLELLLLRRSKSLVAPELPPRIVEVLPVEFESAQRDFYHRILVETKRKIKAGGAMEILSGLTRLRQICCDPELLLKQTHPYGGAKLALLLEKLSEVLANGHSALVFSQFTQMLTIIARELTALELPFHSITGEIPPPQRSRIVEEFSANQQPEIMLLSLKAAGTGLTLTKADYVFLYDPWWTPAVENQAIDRTHRIGQTRKVQVFRLITKASVEEKILSLQQNKIELFNEVIEGGTGILKSMSLEELKSLFSY